MGFNLRTPSLRCSSTSHSPYSSGISLLNIQSWTETITQNPDHLDAQKILENNNAKERAARVIQCYYRGFIERRKFLKVKASALFLQIVTRAWFIGRSKIASNKVDIVLFSHRLSFEHQVIFTRYLQFITERYSFLRIQKSVLLIQRATRRWMTQNHMQKGALLSEEKFVDAATTLQSYIRGRMARSRYNSTASQIQRVNIVHGGKGKINLELEAATQIQIAWRKFIIRRLFLDQICAAIVIQRYWRGWLVKRNFLHQKSAILMIQSGFRLHKCQKEFKLCRLSAIKIQRFARGQLARRKLLGASSCQFGQQMDQCEDLVIWSSSELSETKIFLHSVLILQRWWRRVLWLKSQIRSVVMIQSCIRGWLIREESIRKKRSIVVIQCCWRGYMVRRDVGKNLFDLRNRLLKSKANGDNCMRLIDHLISALSELMGRRVSSILQTCATLDRATGYSQRCCDSLITAGAVNKLLELIQSSNQSPPDREVAKHACSTLRNIACHPDLADVLLSTHGLVETVFQELLRDKDDGYFISCELLKKLCMTHKGIEVVRGSQAFLKRIHAHAEDLKRKANNQRRNPRLFAASATTERRLRAIVDLLELIKDR
ncbi:hypothetical protein QJS04_geneDACA018211 [Acorus gramineus]|uniref:Abnormal spindle-like microcephaly-associated protein n=1 Tax=Acorus gramineus TaxID=55184 RepID=A0AAV9BWC0_ACOGR|nr:hypothetical protein QJS04_geneDACA018211 [Acorus gramineus]